VAQASGHDSFAAQTQGGRVSMNLPLFPSSKQMLAIFNQLMA
jgi:hypothetical protein